jgi:hypothetical protein
MMSVQDTETGEIDLGEEDEWVIEAMIQALYHGDYHVPDGHGDNHDWLLTLEERELWEEMSGWPAKCDDDPLPFHTKVRIKNLQ